MYTCVYRCVQLLYIIQHRTVLIIFSPNLQTIITAQMLSMEAWEGSGRLCFEAI